MDQQRRNLFRLFPSSNNLVIRPPYATDLALFESVCKDCTTKCNRVCEEGIIKILEDETPYIDFKSGGCTYCEACADVCEQNLLAVNEESNPNHIKAEVQIDILRCMSWHKTMCFSCKDPCIEEAIIFTNMFNPEINSNICTNCGFCIAICPVEAISIKGVS